MDDFKLFCRLWMVILTLCIQNQINLVTALKLCSNGTRIVMIDQKKHICCGGVYNRKDQHGLQQECCGIKDGNGSVVKLQLYAQQKQICCDGELHDLPKHHRRHSRDPKCCGVDVIFNPESSFCCNNQIYQRSEQFAYCDDRYGLEVAVGRDQVACKLWTPNGTLHRVYQWQPGYECCGLNLSNTNSHFCLRGKIWPNGAVVSKCGMEIYDENKYICCEDTSKLIPKPGPDKFKAKYLGIETDLACLNGKVVNRDLEQIVENNNKKHVIPNNFLPCGDDYFDPYNKRTQVDCCNGVVNHARPEMNVTCCGTEFIDTDLYRCCNNVKIGASMLCCGNHYFDPYNKRTQVDCCNGVVNHARPEMNVTCCGTEFIDTDLYRCCNNVKIGASKLCCGNQIYERTSGLVCCGTKLINSSYLCCEPKSSIKIPVKKKPGHNRCCGKQTFYYDPNGKDECCGGKIIKLEQNQVCENDIVTFSPEDTE